MYCASCGVTVLSGLRFCNHCGASLAAPSPDVEPKHIRPGVLIAAMAFIFVFGLFAISLLTVILSDGVHLSGNEIMGFAGFTLLILAALEAVFATLLLRRQTRTRERNQINQLNTPKTTEPRTLADSGFGEHVPTVTEHTTRALNYIPNDQPKEMNS